MDQTAESAEWLARFHDGDREVIASCYRKHYHGVEVALGQMLAPVDKETVIHEVFFAVIADSKMRGSFQGGSIGAWLRTVARHRAIDLLRHRQQERGLEPHVVAELLSQAPETSEARTDARALVAEFQAQHLPARWAGVFDARFMRQLTQREAASTLGISRTTLAYQEARIRRLLRKFVLERADG